MNRTLTSRSRRSIGQTTASKGFTLVELMIVVAIIGILMAVALPDFVRSTRITQMTHQAKEMAGAIKLAQSEAVRLRQTVIMCRSNAAQDGCDAAASATGWAAGWIVFADINNNGKLDKPTEAPLAIKSPFPPKYKAITATTATPPSDAMIFNAAGETAGNLGGTATVVFSHLDNQQATSTVVVGLVINRAGRVRVLSQAQCSSEALPCAKPL